MTNNKWSYLLFAIFIPLTLMVIFQLSTNNINFLMHVIIVPLYLTFICVVFIYNYKITNTQQHFKFFLCAFWGNFYFKIMTYLLHSTPWISYFEKDNENWLDLESLYVMIYLTILTSIMLTVFCLISFTIVDTKIKRENDISN